MGLEAVLVGKYLDVDLQVKGRNLVKAREDKMISIAQSYAHTIMGVTRSGLDKALIVHKLWECCAIPSFLYEVEAMTITKSTIEKLEMVQSQVARVILQLPRSASKVAGFMDAGLVPIADRIKERTGLYAWDIALRRSTCRRLQLCNEF